MEKEDLMREYKNKIRERDSLSVVESEIHRLEEEEIIKLYNRITKYYQENKNLKGLSDKAILDLVIQDDKDTLEDIWFCCGKEYWGGPKLIGGYYIDQKNDEPFGRVSTIRLAKYRSFRDINKEVIIPVDQCGEFEKDKKIVYAMTCIPDAEYFDLRRDMYSELIKDKEIETGKKLIKK